jgi:hypothetical protein
VALDLLQAIRHDREADTKESESLNEDPDDLMHDRRTLSEDRKRGWTE